MLTYDLERRGSLARYDYLYRCIKEDILSGRLRAGEKLPSKRSLAAHLGTAVVTVESAYAQLAAEGYLYPREKRGYFVSDLETAALAPPPAQERAGEEGTDRLLELGGGSGGTQGFPFSVWAKLTRRVLTQGGQQLMRATPHNGALALRQAIARHLYQFRGMRVSPEQVVVGAGTQYLYNLVVQLLGRELVYGLEDPGYSKAERIYALNGARCLSLPVDGQGVPLSALEQGGLQVLHISPNHQFPTGVVTPIARRQGMLRWTEGAAERYIIEDDYDSEFRFTGRPIPTLQSIDRAGRVIYINTFSRSLSPALRISYMVLPQSLLERYRQRLGFYTCTVSAIQQDTLAQFIDQGHFQSHIDRMRVLYRKGRDRAIAAIQDSGLGGRCTVRGEQAGLHFLLELDTRLEDEALARAALERGVALTFLTHYQRQPGRARPHTLVIDYPAIEPDQLARGIAVLARLLEQR